jgi:hypothetical protein
VPDPARAPDVRRSAARTATLVAVPVALLVLLGLLWSLGALSRPDTGPVAMDAPALTPEAAQVCRAIVADLPETVAGSTRRAVTAGPEQNAAYGDPPVTLACGTVLPAVEDTATVFPLSGVCWFPQAGTDATVWTTVDRTVPVTVTVPGPQDGSAQTVIAFSEAVGAADPPRPSGTPAGCA